MGLSTKSALAQKLWRVSRVLNVSPFSRELLEHTEPQLDFILEMFALDNPDKYKFHREGTIELTDAERAAEWERKLTGKDHAEFLRSRMPSKAVFDKIFQVQRAAEFLRKHAASGEQG